MASIEKDTIKQIQQALLADLNKATKAILSANKLGTSDLIKSVEWDVNANNDVITLMSYDYLQAVSEGRKVGAPLVPAQDLIPWMKKHSITPKGNMSYNSLAFIISNAIKKHGIKGKFFMDTIIDSATTILSEELAEALSENICDATVAAIENN